MTQSRRGVGVTDWPGASFYCGPPWSQRLRAKLDANTRKCLGECVARRPLPFSYTGALLVAIGLFIVPYCTGYVWARATHRLVNYGTFIARPHVLSGIGFSIWELVFLPATAAEGVVRQSSGH